MGPMLTYLIKSACCLAVFYLFYKLLLSRETFHRFNRFVLLSLLFISAFLPFVQISFHSATVVSQTSVVMGQILMQPVAVNTSVSFQWTWILILVYAAGWLLFAAKMLFSYMKILYAVHKYPSVVLEGDRNIRLILFDRKVGPFSWMHYIVMSKDEYKENGAAILAHEKAHIYKLHSLDVLLADICILFQWFNPAAWLVKKELQNIHEFEADKAVIDAGINAKNYQLLLIRKAVGTRLYSIANSFNHSSLKKRITMMLKKKSNPWARLKYAYVLPLAAISVVAFARTEKSEPLQELSEVKISDLSDYLNQKADKSVEYSLTVPNTSVGNLTNLQKGKTVKSSEGVYDGVETSPQYPGGEKALMSYLESHLKYSVASTKERKERVLSVQFVVDKSGEVRNVKIMRGLAKDYDAEAVRVIRGMPKWEPGKQNGKAVSVRYTLSIHYGLRFWDIKIMKGGVQTTLSSVSADDSEVYDAVDQMPMYPGGMANLMSFIANHLKYPNDAQEAGIEGKVVIQFVVDKTGVIKNPEVMRTLYPSLDNEALRVINLMPKWNPGKKDGRFVSVKFTFPIIFKINRGDDKKKNNTKPQEEENGKNGDYLSHGVTVVGYK